MPRNTGYEGDVVGSVRELTMGHPQVAVRMDFLMVGWVFINFTPVHCIVRESFKWDVMFMFE